MNPENDKVEAYAKALHAIAEANNSLDAVTTDLSHVIDFMKQQPEVRRFLASDNVTTPGKQQALSELLGGQISPILVAFILLMAAAGDVELLIPLASGFSATAGGTQTAIGEIHSAVKLSPQRLAQIEDEVAKSLNRKVKLQPRVINNILGGIRVKIGDLVIDGTLDTQLEEARRQLVE